MKISFYAHYNDLDQINAFLEGTHEDEYEVEVYQNTSYRQLADRSFVETLILVTVSYSEYLKLQPILKFV